MHALLTYALSLPVNECARQTSGLQIEVFVVLILFAQALFTNGRNGTTRSCSFVVETDSVVGFCLIETVLVRMFLFPHLHVSSVTCTVYGISYKRERERERQTERERERKRERETETETERQTERETDRERDTERDTHTHTDTERERDTHTHTETETERETDRQTDRERQRQRQRKRQTDRQSLLV